MMEIEIIELLSDEQKARIAERFEKKILEAIGEADFTEALNNQVSEIIESDFLFEEINLQKVGEIMTARLVKAAKSA
jgi:hypothetical protein